MKILHRYAVSELVPPFGFFLVLCTFVLLIQEVYRMFDLIFRYQVPIGTVLALVLAVLPAMMALTVPMAVLLSLLVGFGRMTADNEFVAMKCCGVSLRPLMGLLLGLGALLTAVMLLFDDTVLPWANYQYRTIYFDIVRQRSAVLIEKPPQVISDFEGYSFFVGRREAATGLLGNVVVFDVSKPQEDDVPPVIVSDHGRLETDPVTRRVVLKLMQGAMHRLPKKEPGQYSRLGFNVCDIDLDIHRALSQRGDQVDKGSREMRLSEIYETIQKEKAAGKDVRGWWAEFWLKIAIPFACLAFVMVGMPLSLMFRRAGQAIGFFVGATLLFLYNVFLEAGDALGERGIVNPHLAVWLGDLVFMGLGAILMVLTQREKVLISEHTFAWWKEWWTTWAARWGRRLADTRAAGLWRRMVDLLAKWIRGLSGIRILDLYVLRNFTVPFVLSMTFVFAILLSSDMIDRMRQLLDNHPSMGALLEYFFWRTPLKIMEVIPVAVFLSVLICLGIFVARREVTAMKAAGVAMYRVWAPLLAASAAISLAALAFNEYVVPYASQRMDHVLKVKIWKNPEGFLQIRNNVAYFEPDHRELFFARLFDGPAFTLHGVILLDFDAEGRLVNRTDASLGRWTNGAWHLYGARLRTFDLATGEERTVTRAPDLVMNIHETPKDMGRPEIKSETMGLRELASHIAKLKAGGLPFLEYEVDFYYRLLLPFASFVLALLACGIPFLFHGGRTSMGLVVALSFLVTLLVVFIYYGLAMAGRSLGANGVLPPLLAVSFSHIFFSAAGFVILARAPK